MASDSAIRLTIDHGFSLEGGTFTDQIVLKKGFLKGIRFFDNGYRACSFDDRSLLAKGPPSHSPRNNPAKSAHIS